VSLAWLRSVVYLQSISFHFLCYVLHCISMARHGWHRRRSLGYSIYTPF
jgi:hypothetical protein